MTSIYYNDEEYTLSKPRYQCLACNQVVEKLFSSCECGKVMIQRGQRKDMNDVRDVSVWKSKSGKMLSQIILDNRFYKESLSLSREAN